MPTSFPGGQAPDVIKHGTNTDNQVVMGSTVHVTKTGKVDRLEDAGMPHIDPSGTYNKLNNRFEVE